MNRLVHFPSLLALCLPRREEEFAAPRAQPIARTNVMPAAAAASSSSRRRRHPRPNSPGADVRCDSISEIGLNWPRFRMGVRGRGLGVSLLGSRVALSANDSLSRPSLRFSSTAARPRLGSRFRVPLAHPVGLVTHHSRLAAAIRAPKLAECRKR